MHAISPDRLPVHIIVNEISSILSDRETESTYTTFFTDPNDTQFGAHGYDMPTLYRMHARIKEKCTGPKKSRLSHFHGRAAFLIEISRLLFCAEDEVLSLISPLSCVFSQELVSRLSN